MSDTVRKKNISVCGSDCGACFYFEKVCMGCNTCEGKVFHTSDGKACPIYNCVKKDKGMPDCGRCGEAPCELWLSTRDPNFSDEEFTKNVTERLTALGRM